MELGKSKEEIALTKHLAATLVQREVIDPMTANGWRHGNTPSPEQAALLIAERAAKDGASEEQVDQFLAERGFKKVSPPAGGQPAKAEGAPAPAATPTAPAQSGQPAPAQATPASAVTEAKTDAPKVTDEAAKNLLAVMESLKTPDGKYMGKYLTVEEALKGAGHLANMAKSALQRAEQAEARLTAVPATPAAQPAAVPAVAPTKPFVPASRPGLEAAQARVDKVLSSLGEEGFTGDSAREYAEATRELAREQALAVAVEANERAEHDRKAASARWDAVNSYMEEKYPDSKNVDEDEFGLYLRSNPLLVDAMTALRAQGREERAAELGYTEYLKSRSGAPGSGTMTRAEAERKEDDLAAREQVRKELKEAALKDAGVIHGSAGGSSAVETPGVTGPTQDEINAAADRMRREGEAPGSQGAMEWRRKVIGRFLPPELFGPQ